MNRTVFKNGNVYYKGEFQQLDVAIEGKKIVAIGENLTGDTVIDITGKLLTLGFVDMHEHLREPGYEYKETIKTGTLSAKYGGYTHIVAMANTMPCMDNVDTIRDFAARCAKDSAIHTYTVSAITKGLKGKELSDFDANSKEPNVIAFSDDGKGVQSKDMMAAAMRKAKENNTIILAHCEDEGELRPGACIHDGVYAKEHNLVGINNASEYNHALRDMELSKEIGNRYHVCHISTKETVAGLRKARNEGYPISGEACPHHLILTDENIKDCNPNYKMNPPLRSKEDLDALIEGLNDGTVQVISTDHAPHSREEKMKPIDKAPFGIIGNQHAFSLCYHYLVKRNLISLKTLLDCMSYNPSKILGLHHDLEVSNDANFVIIDLNKEYVIKEEDIKSKANNTPFIGVTVTGQVQYSVIDGEVDHLYE